jgi:hypothetical protein
MAGQYPGTGKKLRFAWVLSDTNVIGLEHLKFDEGLADDFESAATLVTERELSARAAKLFMQQDHSGTFLQDLDTRSQELGKAFEKHVMQILLKKFSYNAAKAGRSLGLPPKLLSTRIRALDISSVKERRKFAVIDSAAAIEPS